jgi:hypothetical protein
VLLYKLRSGASADVRHARAALLLEEAAASGIPEAAVGTIARNGTVEAAAVEHLLVRELVNRGYLELRLESGAGERLASLLPTGAGFEMGAPPAADVACLLSPFAFLRAVQDGNDGWVLEDPRIAARVELGPLGVAALGALRAAPGNEPPAGAAGELAALLFRAGFMQTAAASIDPTAGHAV